MATFARLSLALLFVSCLLVTEGKLVPKWHLLDDPPPVASVEEESMPVGMGDERPAPALAQKETSAEEHRSGFNAAKQNSDTSQAASSSARFPQEKAFIEKNVKLPFKFEVTGTDPETGMEIIEMHVPMSLAPEEIASGLAQLRSMMATDASTYSLSMPSQGIVLQEVTMKKSTQGAQENVLWRDGHHKSGDMLSFMSGLEQAKVNERKNNEIIESYVDSIVSLVQEVEQAKAEKAIAKALAEESAAETHAQQQEEAQEEAARRQQQEELEAATKQAEENAKVKALLEKAQEDAKAELALLEKQQAEENTKKERVEAAEARRAMIALEQAQATEEMQQPASVAVAADGEITQQQVLTENKQEQEQAAKTTAGDGFSVQSEFTKLAAKEREMEEKMASMAQKFEKMEQALEAKKDRSKSMNEALAGQLKEVETEKAALKDELSQMKTSIRDTANRAGISAASEESKAKGAKDESSLLREEGQQPMDETKKVALLQAEQAAREAQHEAAHMLLEKWRKLEEKEWNLEQAHVKGFSSHEGMEAASFAAREDAKEKAEDSSAAAFGGESLVETGFTPEAQRMRDRLKFGLSTVFVPLLAYILFSLYCRFDKTWFFGIHRLTAGLFRKEEEIAPEFSIPPKETGAKDFKGRWLSMQNCRARGLALEGPLDSAVSAAEAYSFPWNAQHVQVLLQMWGATDTLVAEGEEPPKEVQRFAEELAQGQSLLVTTPKEGDKAQKLVRVVEGVCVRLHEPSSLSGTLERSRVLVRVEAGDAKRFIGRVLRTDEEPATAAEAALADLAETALPKDCIESKAVTEEIHTYCKASSVFPGLSVQYRTRVVDVYPKDRDPVAKRALEALDKRVWAWLDKKQLAAEKREQLCELGEDQLEKKAGDKHAKNAMRSAFANAFAKSMKAEAQKNLSTIDLTSATVIVPWNDAEVEATGLGKAPRALVERLQKGEAQVARQESAFGTKVFVVRDSVCVALHEPKGRMLTQLVEQFDSVDFDFAWPTVGVRASVRGDVRERALKLLMERLGLPKDAIQLAAPKACTINPLEDCTKLPEPMNAVEVHRKHVVEARLITMDTALLGRLGLAPKAAAVN